MRPGGGFSMRLEAAGCFHPPAAVSRGGDDVAVDVSVRDA